MSKDTVLGLSPIVADIAFFIAQQAHATQQYQLAEYWYNHTLKLQPQNPEVHHAMTYVQALQRKYPSAINHSTLAMRNDNRDELTYVRALLYLMMNNYAKGFTDYEARLQLPQNKAPLKARFGEMKYWGGEKCKTLWVAGEQGYGDIIMFSRYVPLIKEKFEVDKVIFEVPVACSNLIGYNFATEDVQVVTNTIKPDGDYYVQLASLPYLFKTVAGQVPELKLDAEPEYIEKWCEVNNFTGVVFTGRHANDIQTAEWNNRRNLPAEDIHRILKGKDVVALQPEYNSNIKSWSDTAGIIANCKLIIACDSGPAHLAAAMGKPVWLLNNYQSCWRWGLEGEQSPWYNKNLRIFRQVNEGDWTPALQKVEEELQKA